MTVIMASCKKEHAKSPTSHSVSFNLTGFSQQLAPFTLAKSSIEAPINNNKFNKTLASNPLSSAFTDLYYIVYDANGNYLHMLHQTSTNTNFGVITDNLQTGTYTAVFIGSSSTLPATGFTNVSLQDAYIASTNYGTSVGDIFYKKVGLNVSQNDSNQSIGLDRIVGQIQVNIEDAIPSPVSSLKIFLNNYSAYSISQATPLTTSTGTSNTVSLTQADIGTTNYNKLSIIALGNLNNINSVTLASYTYIGVNGLTPDVYTHRTIYNIPCQANKITLLTGTLFGGTSSSNNSTNGFKAAIDTSWNATPNIVKF